MTLTSSTVEQDSLSSKISTNNLKDVTFRRENQNQTVSRMEPEMRLEKQIQEGKVSESLL